MPKTSCEYPCSLELWADVVKARYIALNVLVFESVFCVPWSEVGGIIESIDFIQARVVSKHEEFCFNKVLLQAEFEIVFLVLVNDEHRLITINHEYNQEVPLADFKPALTPMELKEDVSASEIILKNWQFEWCILGRCEDPKSPCFQTLTTPISGTCLSLKVWVDIIDKLFKPHDVIVFAEYDPEDDKPC